MEHVLGVQVFFFDFRSVSLVETARHADAWKIGHKKHSLSGGGVPTKHGQNRNINQEQSEQVNRKKRNSKKCINFWNRKFSNQTLDNFIRIPFSNTISKYERDSRLVTGYEYTS